MKNIFKSVGACMLGVALMMCAPLQASAASPAYVSDNIEIQQPSQGILNWAATITDLGGVGSTNINDAAPTIIPCVTAYSPDYAPLTKVFGVYLFLTQAAAMNYLTAHPGTSVAVGWYAPPTRN